MCVLLLFKKTGIHQMEFVKIGQSVTSEIKSNKSMQGVVEEMIVSHVRMKCQHPQLV